MSVEVQNLSRRFGATAAVQDVSFALADGQFLALLGPSGSGKTTLLRLLAGLEPPDAGRILLAGRDITALPAQARGIGVVFQSYALFRHMSVFENVAFGLRVRPRRQRPPEAEIRRRVEELLALVHIPELARRFPEQLSGGQRQRVALARALAIAPALLLLDEPFAALDAAVRKEVRRWVRSLHDRLGIGTILVTHDQEEALELADQVAVLDGGRLVQLDRPERLLTAPASAFVAGFLGAANRLEGAVRGGMLATPLLGTLGPVTLPEGPVRLFLRAEELRFRATAAADARLRLLRAHPAPDGRWRALAEAGGALLEGVLDMPPEAGAPCQAVATAALVVGTDGAVTPWRRARAETAPAPPATLA